MFYILIVGYVRTIVPIDQFDLVYNPSRYILNGMIYSYKEVFANSIFTFICATVACALCATFLSCFTKSKFAAIIPLLMINFLPMLVWNNLGSIINYVPSMMVYMFEVSSWYNVIGFSIEEVYSTVFSLKKIGPFMIQECTQIGIVWIIIFIILTLLCYYKQRKHIVK